MPPDLCSSFVAAMSCPQGDPLYFVIELGCGPNCCLEAATLGAGWTYIGIDHTYSGGIGYTHYLHPEHLGSSHLLTMDLSLYGLHDVLSAIHAWTGLLPGQCAGVLFSPPCTTYSRLEYVNRSHRRDSSGTPHSGPRGSLARMHDMWVSSWVRALRGWSRVGG